MTLAEEINSILISRVKADKEVMPFFYNKMLLGGFTRTEDHLSHFCVYFLPYNERDKKVFLGHHKKSDLWLSPGGHVDPEEGLIGALNRELKEELGLNDYFTPESRPFLLTFTPINNPPQVCREHYDIWYLLETGGEGFRVDNQEFTQTAWLTIYEARKITHDPAHLQALKIIENY